jgi:hypothetical protein
MVKQPIAQRPPPFKAGMQILPEIGSMGHLEQNTIKHKTSKFSQNQKLHQIYGMKSAKPIALASSN